MKKLLEEIRKIVGSGAVLTGSDVTSRDAGWGRGPCEAMAIIRPRTTAEVAAVMKLCHASGQAVVAQGGRTGMADGCVAGAQEIVLSLERMQRIEALDPLGRTITVEAGLPLQSVQEAATEAGLKYPVDFGARGSATIGGSIATNAGGNSVIRYGMTRHHVLGLEVVLADGTIISSLHRTIKDNSGYDLKQWFIGSEGTLGIVTRAVLKLVPAPASNNSALLAVDNFEQVSALLSRLDAAFGGQLSAFEVMWQSYFRHATDPDNGLGRHAPMSRDYPFYILLETQGAKPEQDKELFEATLGEVLEEGLLLDAVLPQSGAERDALWEIRDNIISLAGLLPLTMFDVGVPIVQMPDFLADCDRQLKARWPQVQQVVFGHLGDGNLHYVVSVNDANSQHAVEDIVYHCLQKVEGAVSAEHGIGTQKREWLHCSRTDEEIALMRTIKQALDPAGLLNPGKVI